MGEIFPANQKTRKYRLQAEETSWDTTHGKIVNRWIINLITSVIISAPCGFYERREMRLFDSWGFKSGVASGPEDWVTKHFLMEHRTMHYILNILRQCYQCYRVNSLANLRFRSFKE